MKKAILNNKGYMLVEVIVASVIALVVAYFLIDITIKMVNKNNDFYLKTVLEADKSVITKEIMDDFMNKDKVITAVSCLDESGTEINSSTCSGIKVSFEVGEPKTLKIDGSKIIYGNYVKQLNSNIKLGTIDITHDAEKEMIYIEIPAYSNYSDENYGTNISLKYDPKITGIKIPKIIEVTNIDELLDGKESEYEEKYWNTPNESGYKIEYPSGTYKLEVWGAQGGNNGGNGGYSTGDITLDGTETLYIYVGGAGGKGSSFGFNGGGTTGSSGGAGGGATDIRINTDNLYARVIVAGGGGGKGQDDCATGAVGGGASGGGGASQGNCGTQGGAGTQTAGGAKGVYNGTMGANAGTFGTGGNAQDGSYDGGGGGGGWYGGGAGASAGWSNGGGGGSGFVFTSSSNLPSGYLLGPTYHLANVTTFDGNTCFPSPEGTTSDGCQTGYEKGHSLNGYVKITPLYPVPVLYGLTDLELEKGTDYDLKSDVELICEVNKTGCSYKVSIENASTLSAGINYIEYIVKDTSGNKYKYIRKVTILETDKFDYEGNVKMIEYTPGKYKLEVWGAQGGSHNTSYGEGGKGGYSTGILTLTNNTTLYIYVGGQGGTVTSTNLGYLATGVNNKSGGFNGGANATYYGGGGGGASDIRIGQDSLYARVIVAGGGGGAQGRQTTSYKASGGYGGGISGGDGEYYNGNTSTTYNGKGATQISGGLAGTYSSYPASAGTFGIGGVAGSYYSTTYRGPGAGGGGWYGGGGGAYRYAGGGGGSGWVYTAANETYTSSTGGTWLLNSSYHLTNAQTIAGDTCFPSPDGTTSDDCDTGYEKGHSGNGYVKISKIN